MWENRQETAYLVTFTKEILDGKLHFFGQRVNLKLVYIMSNTKSKISCSLWNPKVYMAVIHCPQEKCLCDFSKVNLFNRRTLSKTNFVRTHYTFYYLKSVCICSFSSLYFPSSGLNVEIYSVNLRIQFEITSD